MRRDNDGNGSAIKTMARRAGRRTLGWTTIRRILTILSIIVYIYIYKRGEIGKIDLECDFRFFLKFEGVGGGDRVPANRI